MANKLLNNASKIDEGNLRRLLNFGRNEIAAHHGKVEYTTVFLHSDWLYFLWHGINRHAGTFGLQGGGGEGGGDLLPEKKKQNARMCDI